MCHKAEALNWGNCVLQGTIRQCLIITTGEGMQLASGRFRLLVLQVSCSAHDLSLPVLGCTYTVGFPGSPAC